jgi:hypothetical protein
VWSIRSVNDVGDAFRPTHLMAKVSVYVSAHVGELPSRNQVEESVKGRREFVRQAIDALLEEGYLHESDGPRNARLLRSVQPFRE